MPTFMKKGVGLPFESVATILAVNAQGDRPWLCHDCAMVPLGRADYQFMRISC